MCVSVCVCVCVRVCVYVCVEAVSHALCWTGSRGDSQTTHAIMLTDSLSSLQKVKDGMESPDWNVSMVNVHFRKLLWVYYPGHAKVKGNDRADRLAGKATLISGLPSQVACFSEDLKC